MAPTILVTGASGRVGGALVRALAGRAGVRRAVRAPAMADDGSGQEEVRFDFTDPATHRPALDGIDAVFLMRPPRMAGAGAFRPFLDACVAAGARRIVVLSVRGADRVRVLPHHGLEREVMARPIDWTMLRPADFMQNLETVLRDGIVRRNEIAVPAGQGRSAFVDVDDVGAAAATVLLEDGHGTRGYELTGPAALGFDRVAAMLSDVLGRTIRYRSPSPPRFVIERRRAGTPVPMALVMTALYTAQRLGLADGVTDDLSRLLGRPATPVADYLRRERETWVPDR